jgi:hypothetical protein
MDVLEATEQSDLINFIMVLQESVFMLSLPRHSSSYVESEVSLRSSEDPATDFVTSQIN